jgi:hypothetical protein
MSLHRIPCVGFISLRLILIESLSVVSPRIKMNNKKGIKNKETTCMRDARPKLVTSLSGGAVYLFFNLFGVVFSP